VQANLPTGQYVTVHLTGVTDPNATTGNFSATMGVLVGDTTANGSVNSSDIAQTQSQSGQPVTAANFREDVTVDGAINSSDVALVQSQSGTALPPAPPPIAPAPTPINSTPSDTRTSPAKTKPRKDLSGARQNR
jgi:hypothetical protein